MPTVRCEDHREIWKMVSALHNSNNVDALLGIVSQVQIAEALATDVIDPDSGYISRPSKLTQFIQAFVNVDQKFRSTFDMLPTFFLEWVDFIRPRIAKLSANRQKTERWLETDGRIARRCAIEALTDLGYSIETDSFGEVHPGQVTIVNYWPEDLYSHPENVPASKRLRVFTSGMTASQLVEAQERLKNDFVKWRLLTSEEVRGMSGIFAIITGIVGLVLLVIAIVYQIMEYNEKKKAIDAQVDYYKKKGAYDLTVQDTMFQLREQLEDWKKLKATLSQVPKYALYAGGAYLALKVLRVL